MAASQNPPPTLVGHITQHAILPIAGQLLTHAIAPATSAAAATGDAAGSALGPRLGLTKDNAPVDGFVHFSGLITRITDERGTQMNLDDPAVFSDGRLCSIAAEAYNDMLRLLKQAPENTYPAVISVLAASNEIYISSSVKYNSPGLRRLFPDSPVVDSLERCASGHDPTKEGPPTQGQKEGGDVHRTAGNCGEPAALQLYYMRHPNPKGSPRNYEMPKGSRIVSWNGKEGRVIPPCGSDIRGKEWGCERFTTEMNVRAINRGERVSIPEDWQITAVPVSLST